MGSRRTHEEAAVAAARAAYVAGFATTSNLAARQRYGVPTAGTRRTASRCCTTPRRTPSAPRSARSAPDTTLLVDTYDVAEAVRRGVEVAGPGLGAVRLDSGDLGVLARRVRRQLDDLGATETRIVVTTDLDEYAIAALAAAPVDGYGVGTPLVTGSGHPTCGFVYKLVSRADEAGALVPVAKKSKDKTSVGGRKFALRRRSAAGVAEAEVIGIGGAPGGRRQRPPAAGPAGPRRRGGRAASRWTPPATGTRPRAPSCRSPPSRCRAASRSSTRCIWAPEAWTRVGA